MNRRTVRVVVAVPLCATSSKRRPEGGHEAASRVAAALSKQRRDVALHAPLVALKLEGDLLVGVSSDDPTQHLALARRHLPDHGRLLNPRLEILAVAQDDQETLRNARSVDPRHEARILAGCDSVSNQLAGRAGAALQQCGGRRVGAHDVPGGACDECRRANRLERLLESSLRRRSVYEASAKGQRASERRKQRAENILLAFREGLLAEPSDRRQQGRPLAHERAELIMTAKADLGPYVFDGAGDVGPMNVHLVEQANTIALPRLRADRVVGKWYRRLRHLGVVRGGEMDSVRHDLSYVPGSTRVPRRSVCHGEPRPHELREVVSEPLRSRAARRKNARDPQEPRFDVPNGAAIPAR